MTRLEEFEHKRGDSFELDGQLLEPDGTTPVDLTGADIAAQLNDGDTLVQTFSVALINAALGQYRMTASYADTADWPLRALYTDVQFTIGTWRRSTETIVIRCVRDYTVTA